MKKIIYSLVLLFTISLILVSCEEDKGNFDYDSYTPVITGEISGPMVGYASGLAPLTYSAIYRGGSTYNWSVSGIDAIIEIDEVYPNVAHITFGQSNENILVTISVTETAHSGITSEPISATVQLKKFAPLAISGFNGTWTGTDAGYDPVTITTTSNNATSVIINNLSEEMIADWWGEPIQSRGTVTMEIGLNNGTINIPRQYIYTTTWASAPYNYEIIGTGTWDNTGASPTLTINYDIYYAGDADGIGITYGGEAFTATFTLN